MNRITESNLKCVCDRINKITNSPPEPYAKVGDRYIAQIGCYHLSYAYGGVALHRMINDNDDVSNIFGGYVPRRELYERMHAFICGLNERGGT